MILFHVISISGLSQAEVLFAITLSLALTLGGVAAILGRAGPRGPRPAPLLRRLSRRLSARALPGDEERLLFAGPHLREAPESWRHLMGQGADGADDWQRLHRLLSARFPAIPTQEELPERGTIQLLADTRSTPACLRIARQGARVEVTITEPRPSDLSDRYRGLTALRDLNRLAERVAQLPTPAWTMADDGTARSGNLAFAHMAERLDKAPEALSPLLHSGDHSEDRPPFTYRALLPAEGRQPECWLDITARRADGQWDCAAQDVSALVKAERAQRDFVQTLTKTFAQLSTGLAIFDRDRQLMLFNPALLDLTRLSPEFLTSRPALAHFFDQLRDRQIMPEPKNYASWRDHMSDMVSAAADGRYLETWSLASGATYQITGRPHPNGAVAFLFEDITDQISTTRRLRQQLSLSQNVLDAFPDAIAIFDGEGRLSHCNTPYRELFDLPSHGDLGGVTTLEALEIWAARTPDDTLPEGLRQQLDRRSRCDGPVQTIALVGRGRYGCHVRTLPGGAQMVSFRARLRDPVRPGHAAPLQLGAG